MYIRPTRARNPNRRGYHNGTNLNIFRFLLSQHQPPSRIHLRWGGPLPRTLMGHRPRRHTVHRPDSGRPGRPRQNLGPLGDLQHTCQHHRTARCGTKEQDPRRGSLQGKNDFDRIGYNGPCPPPRHSQLPCERG